MKCLACFGVLVWSLVACAVSYDVVIYGGTSAGIACAVQAKRMGLTPVVIEPSQRIGGLTTGGLGQTDIGNKNAFGGIAIEFYRDVRLWYDDPRHWKHQKFSDYSPDGQCSGTKLQDTMWTFEPSAALAILESWEKRDGLEIVRGERLDRRAGATVREAGRIVSIRMESGRVFSGSLFVDATYEGDLMAASGVAYVVGRESNAEFKETLNGNQPDEGYHKFTAGVDPYVVPGDPASGLLPGIEKDTSSIAKGTGDRRVQAYCFRMCLTDVESNRIPFEKPANYDERDYELLFREYAQCVKKGKNVASIIPWINSKMPCRKTDTNNCLGFSTDAIGENWAWPDASYAERARIFARHLTRQQGLMWTLANHPRIPKAVRREVSRWGTCRDEFLDASSPGKGWQGQLYVREARRMRGAYVMTEHNCRGTVKAPHPIAKGAYGMDSHHVRRYVGKDGFVQNEGDVEVHHDARRNRLKPYGIDYGAITPTRRDCENLLVPVCISATHIAFGSIRMEPVFFALGQAAGAAAALAKRAGCAVQDVDYKALRACLDEPAWREDGVIAQSQPASAEPFDRLALSVAAGKEGAIYLDGAWRLADDRKVALKLQKTVPGPLFSDGAQLYRFEPGFSQLITVRETPEGLLSDSVLCTFPKTEWNAHYAVRPVGCTNGFARTYRFLLLNREKRQVLACPDSVTDPAQWRVLFAYDAMRCARQVSSIGFLFETGEILLGTGYPERKTHRFGLDGREICDAVWPRAIEAARYVYVGRDTWAISSTVRKVALRTLDCTSLAQRIDTVSSLARDVGGWWLGTSRGAEFYPDPMPHARATLLPARCLGGCGKVDTLAILDGRVYATVGTRICAYWLDDRPLEPMCSDDFQMWHLARYRARKMLSVGVKANQLAYRLDFPDGKVQDWLFDPRFTDWSHREQRLQKCDLPPRGFESQRISLPGCTVAAAAGDWAVGYSPSRKALIRFRRMKGGD